MSPRNAERRPVGGGASDPQKIRLQGTAIDLELARRADLEGYVVRAVTTMTNGHLKTQHFNSLHSAVRAQERAEDRGCLCVLALCRVVPVPHVDLDGMGGETR